MNKQQKEQELEKACASELAKPKTALQNYKEVADRVIGEIYDFYSLQPQNGTTRGNMKEDIVAILSQQFDEE